jgi:cytochrome b
MIQVRVWDLPTRVFHWALAILVAALVVSGLVGGEAMIWHFRFGYCVGSLIIFRVVWGFVGGFWSRWRQFSCSPTSLKAFLSGKTSTSRYLGHSPTGSLSVIVILLFLAAQVGSGMMSDDEISNAGPLTPFVSGAIIQWATYWHKEIGKVVILSLVALHVLAIAWYFYKKNENLLRPMLTGDKMSHDNAPASKDRPVDWLKAILLMAASAYAIYKLINLVP